MAVVRRIRRQQRARGARPQRQPPMRGAATKASRRCSSEEDAPSDLGRTAASGRDSAYQYGGGGGGCAEEEEEIFFSLPCLSRSFRR